MEGDQTRVLGLINPEHTDRKELQNKADAYMDMFKGDKTAAERKSTYATMVNNFYDLVTDFYEYGWGHSFHFAPRHMLETFEGSISRHEYWLAYMIGLKKGMKCIDLGCGIGGPARLIAHFTQANITGINNNAYQIKRGNQINEKTKMGHLVNFQKGDFMNIPAEDNTYDCAYEIEASCHAPDKVGLYSEILRVTKPGGYFGCYEWCMTEKWDPQNPQHNRIKSGIEKGNGLPDLEPVAYILESLKEAGWEVVHHEDRALTGDIGWEYSLSGSFSLTGFKHTRLGRMCTNLMVKTLEWAKIAPKGSTQVSEMLNETAEDLVAGGETGIFTPCYFVLCRKPE